MNVLEKIEKDYLSAFKNNQEDEVRTLRLIKNALANAKIEKRKDLNEAEINQILQKEIKIREDAILQFQKGNRPDLAEKEKEEIKIIKKYLPRQLSEEEIRKEVYQIISQTRAKGSQDLGKVMGQVMAKLAGKAQGSIVARVVGEELKKIEK